MQYYLAEARIAGYVRPPPNTLTPGNTTVNQKPDRQKTKIDSKKTSFNFAYVILAVVGIFMLHNLILSTFAAKSIAYSDFLVLLREGKVEEVTISTNLIRGTLREPQDGWTRFTTTRVDTDLSQKLDEYGVKYSGRLESNWLTNLLSWVLPVLLFLGLWMFVVRRMMRGAGPGGGLMAIGKSKAKVYVESDTRVTFEDVAGVDEAKGELQEVVAFLKEPAAYGRLGARMPKGILLVGPPGTGKTLLARAVAGEAKVPFFSISGSEFVEMFVGVGAARVRDLFEQARGKAPCIIFVDELDALGKARASRAGFGGHDEKEQTLNQLLVELDGFDPSSGIVLLGATNRPEILDPALLRAGRFDRQILVDRPERSDRTAILTVHMRKIENDDTVDVEKLAALTPGFTGADLANLVNEAALMATRRGAPRVGMEDFTMAIERLVAGLERKSRLLNPREREIVAYHEMGHALVAGALPGSDPVHKVSIIPRGIGALGYTLQRPSEDRYLLTREHLENKMAVLLGGRAAEKLIFGHLSTGASDDLNRASDIARDMVMRFGMVEDLGHVSYEAPSQSFLGEEPAGFGQPRYGVETANLIDKSVRGIVKNAYNQALGILTTNRALLEKSAAQLLSQETLDEADIAALREQLTAAPATSGVDS
jgi:cell division protease FtsH